jgi:maltooligosyltrehalose trehalohydrolase
VPLEKLIFSEIHLGTYTAEGTADAAARFMPELGEAGYSAVELMPIAAFPGARNWGYDGAAPFAAHADYGGPAGIARLIDAAHAAGLSAFLDVVYNHLGPEGNYLGEFGPYFTSRHKTPWGDALDFSLAPVRRYFIENALRWVAWFDGLRLDAVHGIYDDSPGHILQEIAEAVHAQGALVIAESDLNDPKLVHRYGMDSVWADDLHHSLHVALTGESQGYYQDYQQPLAAMVAALQRGFYYQGQFKPSFGRKHGAPAGDLPGRRFVVCGRTTTRSATAPAANGSRRSPIRADCGSRRRWWRCSPPCRSTSRARNGRRKSRSSTSPATATRPSRMPCARAGARSSSSSPGRARCRIRNLRRLFSAARSIDPAKTRLRSPGTAPCSSCAASTRR